MLDLKKTRKEIEAIKCAADAQCQYRIAANDSGGYYRWNMFRLELGSVLARLQEVMEYDKVTEEDEKEGEE